MFHSTKRLSAASIFASVALVSLAGAAQAATVTTGDIQVNSGGATEEVKIFFDAATDTTTGAGHFGSQTGTPVFTFTTDVNVDFANGFATITPSDTDVISSLTFTVPDGYFFTDLVFATLGNNSQTDNDITITAFNGATEVGSYTNDDAGNGLKDWLVVAINGALMDSLVITSEDGFEQLKQFSISGLQICVGPTCTPVPGPGPGDVPIPGALPLFTSGLGLLGFLGWRRKRQLARQAA